MGRRGPSRRKLPILVLKSLLYRRLREGIGLSKLLRLNTDLRKRDLQAYQNKLNLPPTAHFNQLQGAFAPLESIIATMVLFSVILAPQMLPPSESVIRQWAMLSQRRIKTQGFGIGADSPFLRW
jgi:hypothetical protein